VERRKIKSYHGSYVCFDPSHSIRDIEKTLKRKFKRGTVKGLGAGGQDSGYYFYANQSNEQAFKFAASHAESRAENVWRKLRGRIGTQRTACSLEEKALPLVYEVEIPYPSKYLLADYEVAAKVLGSWFFAHQDTIRSLAKVPHPYKNGSVIVADDEMGDVLSLTVDESTYNEEEGWQANLHETTEGYPLFNLKNFIVKEPTGVEIDWDDADAYQDLLESLQGDESHHLVYYTPAKTSASLRSLVAKSPDKVEYWDFNWYVLQRSGWTEHIVNVIIELAHKKGIDLASDLLDRVYKFKRRGSSKSAFKWVGKALPIKYIYMGYTDSFAEGWETDLVEDGWLRVDYEGVTWNYLKVSPKGLTQKQRRILQELF